MLQHGDALLFPNNLLPWHLRQHSKLDAWLHCPLPRWWITCCMPAMKRLVYQNCYSLIQSLIHLVHATCFCFSEAFWGNCGTHQNQCYFWLFLKGRQKIEILCSISQIQSDSYWLGSETDFIFHMNIFFFFLLFLESTELHGLGSLHGPSEVHSFFR